MLLFTILYLVGFARTILVIAIIYFAIRLISRYILPMIVQKGVKNMQDKMQDEYRSQQRPRRQEGEVTIEKNRGTSNQRNSDKGEYIDFEEVE